VDASQTTTGPTTRGLIGVMGGVVLYLVITEVLETALVGALGAARATDDASYYAIRNTPTILGAKLFYNSLSAIWAGYMAGRLATENELAYGKLAAAVLTAYLAWQLLATAHATFTPLWMRAFVLLTTGPAMLVGAWIRAQAHAVEDPEPPPTQEPA
jgi:hypothetical protein